MASTAQQSVEPPLKFSQTKNTEHFQIAESGTKIFFTAPRLAIDKEYW